MPQISLEELHKALSETPDDRAEIEREKLNLARERLNLDKRKQDEVKAKLLAIFGKTICSDLDTEDITDIIDELLKEYEK